MLVEESFISNSFVDILAKLISAPSLLKVILLALRTISSKIDSSLNEIILFCIFISPKTTERNSPSLAFIKPSEFIPSEISNVVADKLVIFASLKSKSSKVVIVVTCELPEGSILLVNLPFNII